MRQIISLISFSLGGISLLLCLFLIWQRVSPYNLSFSNSDKIQYTEVRGSLPTKIDIPSLLISLPIIPSRIEKGIWQTTPHGVSYLIGSPKPGEKGNSIFYGHNWRSLLGSLPDIHPGESIVITFSDKKKLVFKVKETQIVSPDNVSVVMPTQDTRLTLYTCTGWFDSKRFIVIATPL